MFPRTAQLFESLLRRLVPPSGRRRAVDCTAASLEERLAARATRRSRVPYVPMVRGEDTLLVRPYLVAYERTHGLECAA
ncbi:hypothetical protein [Streptomyces sioyaensis]|uniref:hypothetical protein n=1 Tax=Streptomyces sioyaensis TaxID=67364 RepID=UPI00379537F7